MKSKRLFVDSAMVLLLLLMMAYSLIGERFHEIAGTLMLCLFLAHHWMNRGWWKTMLRGKYLAQRALRTALDLLLLVFMIAQPLCGVMMSKHLYRFLPTANLSSVARAIHLPLAYWGFVLISLHAGGHLGVMLTKGKGKTVALSVMGLVSLYGVYAFVTRQIPAYMFGRIAFVFFDYGEPLAFFFLDYLAVMVLFAFLGCGIIKILQKTGVQHEDSDRIFLSQG